MLPYPIFGNVYMYGIMIAVGLLLCFLVLWYYGKKVKMDQKFTDFVYFNGIASILFGFVSAAFFQGIYDYIEKPSEGYHGIGSGDFWRAVGDFIKNPKGGFNFETGITFLGGFIGGIGFFFAVYFILRKKLPKFGILDALMVAPACITIAHSMGRVGCFFAGCCYGKETNSPLGVKFPLVEGKVYPTQLFEAIFLLVLFIVLSVLILKFKFRYTMPVYLASYGVFRFVNEFFRGDHRGNFVGGISPSQFWSLAFIPAAVGLFFLIKYLWKKREEIN